jgi:translation initiation factor 2 subunit 1
MYYHKNGLPQDDELALCTITSVQYNSVFCSLDEYPGKSGMIHISEVTAGRIRNIREYVQEGRKIVCKILAVDQQRGHIDLSLRRVNERQRIEKQTQLKHEGKAENLLGHVAKELKRDPKEFYDEVAPAIFVHYEYLFQAFEDIVEGLFSLEKDAKIEKKLAHQIEELVRERIKPKQVEIEGEIAITTFAPGGVTLVREALIAAREAAQPAEIRYLGGGHYRISVTAEEYKDAEKRLKAASDTVERAFKKVPASQVTFTREEE